MLKWNADPGSRNLGRDGICSPWGEQHAKGWRLAWSRVPFTPLAHWIKRPSGREKGGHCTSPVEGTNPEARILGRDSSAALLIRSHKRFLPLIFFKALSLGLLGSNREDCSEDSICGRSWDSLLTEVAGVGDGDTGRSQEALQAATHECPHVLRLAIPAPSMHASYTGATICISLRVPL